MRFSAELVDELRIQVRIGWPVAASMFLNRMLPVSSILFLGMKFSIGVRVPEDVETAGMDSSKHGGMVDYAVGVAPVAPKAEAGAEA